MGNIRQRRDMMNDLGIIKISIGGTTSVLKSGVPPLAHNFGKTLDTEDGMTILTEDGLAIALDRPWPVED